MKANAGPTVRGDLAPLFNKILGECGATAPEGHKSQPAVALALVEDALIHRVSDIHVEPQKSDARIRFRIDGIVCDVARTQKDAAQLLINQYKAMAGLDPIIRFTPHDAHANVFAGKYATDVRLALTPCQGGEALSLRILDARRLERTIDDPGLSQANLTRLEQWLENVKGMFLASGPTGAGKTTTIYSLLHELKYNNRTIVSLEDPVEYQLDGITQVGLDEKHHLNFAEGVKAVLRLDPDYIMLGEIRDGASAHAAVNAAISGRVLLSTIHSRDAVGTLTALRNWGLADHQIAESLTVVAAQRLVRKLCENCRRKSKPDPAEAAWLRALGLNPPRTVWKPVGCEKCKQLGYFGRTGVFEFWQLDGTDYEMILAHRNEHEMRDHLASREHESLLKNGLAKVAEGITTIAELRQMSGGALTQYGAR
jgi:type II secretory ATPase GspE/PulE/Tfp pilus assembly ATPase PilB-like protein